MTDNQRPAIEHSLLSPSGRMSKRARRDAIKREAEKLFPPGFWDKPAKTPEEIRSQKIESMQRRAAELRTLADRGMNSRKFRREADKIDLEINGIIPD